MSEASGERYVPDPSDVVIEALAQQERLDLTRTKPTRWTSEDMELERLAAVPPWHWPGDAASVILDRMAGGNEVSQRRLAIELAGDLLVMNDDLARALVAIVDNRGEDEELRGRAAISLGPVLEEADWTEPDDPYDPPCCSEEVLLGIRRSLADVYRSADAPRDVRRRALEASVRRPENWHPGAARAAYHDSDPAWRVTGVFCMRYLPGFDQDVLEALSSDDPDVLFEAVRTAGARGLREAWPRIRALLDPEMTERALLLAAIDASATVGEVDEVAEALHPLADLGDEEILEAVTDAIAEAELWAGLDDEEDEELDQGLDHEEDDGEDDVLDDEDP